MSGTEKDVFIRDASYNGSMGGIIAEILEYYPLNWKGKKVLVKPNILSPNTPDKAATTHPLLVKHLTGQLVLKGAAVVVGDNPGVLGYGMSEKAGKVTGIKDAAGEAFIHLGRAPVKHPVKSRFFDHLMISRDVLEADIVVNLPKLKTHSLTYYTGAIKNTFGYVAGGDKMRVHSLAKTPRGFSEALVDIYQVRPPDLTIMDAVDAMEGNGPSNGTVRRIGKVLASRNGVNLDVAALHLAGRAAKSVTHVRMAGERGLGAGDISELTADGEIEPVKGFVMPSTFVPGAAGLILNRLLARWVNCVPAVLEDTCRVCGICVKHCPVGAMRMDGAYPSADKKACISCYCCQEMCPHDAIALSGRMINFIRNTPLYGQR